MFCTNKAISFLLLPTILLVCSTFFSFSRGTPQFHHLQTLHIPGARRYVLEQNNGANVYDTSLILAAERTHRKDPFDDFNYYRGGWNISEEHYISSVAFTAAPLFIIAAIWFLGFGICLLVLSLFYCCCRRRPYGYSRTAYALSLIFLALFTIAAVVGSIVLYTGQGKFHNSTKDTLDYVVRQADTTVNKLKNVSDYLSSAKRVGVDQIFLPPDVQNKIDHIDSKINSSATTLERETRKNSDDIEHVLNSLRLILIIVAATMLLLAFLGFALSVLGLQFLVYILVIIGWVLVAITFIMCAAFLVVHNVMGDTCVAMGQWIQNPTAHTALDDILPCLDNTTAQETYSESKDVTFQLVGVVNQVITNISNRNVPPSAGPLYYNQSGPLVPVLCNPFNLDKTDRICVAGEVDFGNASQVWKDYVCQVSSSNICTTVGRLTPNLYNQMISAVNVSHGLYDYSPFLVGLLDCSFVRETFTGINDNHCPDLRQYSELIYIGLAMVSSSILLSLILWVLYARERRHRKYTKLANDARSVQESFQEKGP